jgi:Tetratricopeptide repeat
VWQALHAELSDRGVSIVTVALNSDIEAARPFVDAAKPTHPSLVDSNLSLVELFGITNVPFGLWIDEQGTIVRPAEVAFAPRDGHDQERWNEQEAFITRLPEGQRKVVEGMTKSIGDPGVYAGAVRDWVANGKQSRYVLTSTEVVKRSRARPVEHAQAAAHFELALYLYRSGSPERAIAHFREAHRLDPTNWTYVRDIASLGDRALGGVYERDMLEEVAAVGPETFYPPLEL